MEGTRKEEDGREERAGEGRGGKERQRKEREGEPHTFQFYQLESSVITARPMLYLYGMLYHYYHIASVGSYKNVSPVLIYENISLILTLTLGFPC